MILRAVTSTESGKRFAELLISPPAEPNIPAEPK